MNTQPKFYNILKLLCFSTFMAGIIILIHPSSSCAQSKSGCAADTWTAMVNQAVLETRREDMMNKRYIVKADSVLQYSCFQAALENTANQAGPIFSVNPMWDKKPVEIYFGDPIEINVNMPSDTMKLALKDAVQVAYIAYLDAQFGHPVLSGTGGPVPEGAQAASTYKPQPCYNMQVVWQLAKCKNFDGTQVFYRFDDLIGFDPRVYPPNMPCEL